MYHKKKKKNILDTIMNHIKKYYFRYNNVSKKKKKNILYTIMYHKNILDTIMYHKKIKKIFWIR